MLAHPAEIGSALRVGVVDEDFPTDDQRLVFAAVRRLYQRGETVGPTTLAVELERAGDFERAGGNAAMQSLLLDAPGYVEGAEQYALMVKRTAQLREVTALFLQLAARAESGRELPGDLAEHAIRGLSGVVGPRDRSLELLDDVAIGQRPPLEYIVDGILPAGGLAVLYGPPGSGKSFVILDLACAIATGEPWLSHPIRRRGPVVYVAGEGIAGMSQRLTAWKESRGVDPAEPIGVFFVEEPLNLFTGEDTERLMAAVRRLPAPPVLIVFDTLARSMSGGEENSSKDVGLVVENAGRLQRLTGAAVAFAHHSRKDGESERGSSALRGAADAMLFLKVEDDRRLLVCEKAKDSAAFQSIALELVPTGQSCVVSRSVDARESGGGILTPKHIAALIALSECSLGGAASGTVWREQTGLPTPTFYRTVTFLKTEGYVALRERGAAKLYSLTDSGRSAVSRHSHSILTHSHTAEQSHSHTLTPPLGGERSEKSLRLWSDESDGWTPDESQVSVMETDQ
jgi:hypothetical protein